MEVYLVAEFANKASIKTILDHIPQQAPFRFIDEILHLSEKSCKGEYTFREDEYFYQGHFPLNPITPGVILVETMAQIGLITIGLYQFFLKDNHLNRTPLFLFAECEVQFQKPVIPPCKVIVESKKIFYRRNKLKAEVTMKNGKEDIIVSGVLSGFVVEKNNNGSK